ncbi:MAG: DNA polymerase III subunit alpha, partial [Planctomycetota bacterium]
MKNSFTHLHLHSQYSIIDGFSTIEEIINVVKEYGMNSVALTDHGTLAGSIDFYKQAIKSEIKPILGCEIYTTGGSRFEKKLTEFDDKSSHLTILAKNDNGFHNLINIVSAGYLEGFYYKPRVDIEVLRKYKEDLIVLSGCINSEFAKYILEGNIARAKETIGNFIDIYSRDNFYIEIQQHNLEEDKTYLPQALKIAKDMNIKVVATNDCHYTRADNYYAYDVLLCIKNGRKLQDADRLKLEPNEFYIKSPEEMFELFKDIPEALHNSSEIAQMTQIQFDFSVKRIPVYRVEDGRDSHNYLVELCKKGLHERVKNVNEKYIERLEYELNVVKTLGFSDYFLIVYDIITFAKSKNIYIGPGRGSAASSLISFSLGITDIDPLQYNLLFERFLNTGRNEPPDIDIDIEHQRRQEVIDYLREKYGENNIAHILTFGTLSARAVIRDVGRVINMPYSDVDRIAKMIPDALNITIEKALNTVKELKQAYENNKDVKNIIDIANQLEGRIRNISTHAAGVVISDKPLTTYIPLQKAENTIITGVDANTLIDLGLLK